MTNWLSGLWRSIPPVSGGSPGASSGVCSCPFPVAVSGLVPELALCYQLSRKQRLTDCFSLLTGLPLYQRYLFTGEPGKERVTSGGPFRQNI